MGSGYDLGDRVFLWVGRVTGISYDWLYRRQSVRWAMIFLDKLGEISRRRPR